MSIMKFQDQERFNNGNFEAKRNSSRFNYHYFNCPDCNYRLFICQIQRKNIDNFREFAVFTYYCRKCKLTYFIFKFINKKEVKQDGLSR